MTYIHVMSRISRLDIKEFDIVFDIPDLRIFKFRKLSKTRVERFVDFSIDGIRINEIMMCANSDGVPEFSTLLSDGYDHDTKRSFVNRLRNDEPGDLDSGRVALMVCPIDGDLECGAIGMRVRFDKDSETVTWYDFAWDGNEGEDVIDYGDDDGDEEKVAGLDEFSFDRSEYLALMNRILHYERDGGDIVTSA